MALHELIGWILRLELLWVGCVKFDSIGADILRSIDALLTLIEMTDMELCVHSYGEDSCVENITGIWSWLELLVPSLVVLLSYGKQRFGLKNDFLVNSIILANRLACFYRKFLIANFHIKAGTISASISELHHHHHRHHHHHHQHQSFIIVL